MINTFIILFLPIIMLLITPAYSFAHDNLAVLKLDNKGVSETEASVTIMNTLSEMTRNKIGQESIVLIIPIAGNLILKILKLVIDLIEAKFIFTLISVVECSKY